jgi:hypothetical protein
MDDARDRKTIDDDLAERIFRLLMQAAFLRWI